MAKLTLKTIGSGFLATQAIDENFSAIETFLDTLLSRDGAAPNTMLATLDMNSNRIINTTDPVNLQDVATKNYVDSILASGIADQAGNAGLFLTTDGSTTSWADPLPDQTGQAGNFLTTDGSAASWAAGIFLPALVANRLVTNNGTTANWSLNFLVDEGLNPRIQANDAAGPAFMNEAVSATNPGLVVNRADLTTGWGAQAAGVISGIVAGAEEVRITANGVTAPAADGAILINETPTLTNPGISPSKSDLDTGLGWGGDGILTVVVNGVEIARFDATGLTTTLSGNICVLNANGACLQNEAASVTNPTVVPDRTNVTSGLGALSTVPVIVDDSLAVASFIGSPSAVNYLSITSGATGVGPVIAPTGVGTGGDADIDLNLQSFGAGTLSTVAGQSATPTAAGGNVLIRSGAGGVTSGDSGDVTISTGVVTSGSFGDIFFQLGTVTEFSLLGTGFEAANAAGPLLVNEAASSTNPTLIPNKADPDTGIGWFAGNVGSLVAGGTGIAFWTNTTGFSMSQSQGAQLRNEDASETNPTLIPDRSEPDSGMGIWANNSPSIISINEEVARFNSTVGPTLADSRWEFTPANVATDGENLILEATGTPSDITMEINAKGTGVIQIGSNLLASNAAGPAIQNEASSGTNPTLLPNQANASTGIGNTGTAVEIISNGLSKLRVGTGVGQANIVFQPLGTSGLFLGSVSGSFGLHNLAASATVPSVLPNHLDEDTGVGSAAVDSFGIVAGGVAAANWTEASNEVLHNQFVTTGITASTTQTQGQQPLLASWNDVTTVANVNDVVTAPAASAGRQLYIYNAGANTLQIFPASGDDLGAGTDTSVTLATNTGAYWFAINTSTWRQMI